MLQASKSAEELTAISNACFKLNSLQVRSFLERYQPDSGEVPISRDLIDNIVKVVENGVDEMLRNDGVEIELEEAVELELPFLLPEDGYSPESVRGIPAGLKEFVDSLLVKGKL